MAHESIITSLMFAGTTPVLFSSAEKCIKIWNVENDVTMVEETAVEHKPVLMVIHKVLDRLCVVFENRVFKLYSK